MGINAGIKVMRRITDEQRWKSFLRAVVEYFKDNSEVRMEVKINLDAHPEPSSCTLLQSFHLTEAFNFVPGDDSRLGFWNTEFQSANRQLYDTIGITDEDEVEEFFQIRYQSQHQLFTMRSDSENTKISPYLNSKFEERYQFYENMRIKEETELKEATMAKLKSEVIRLNYMAVNVDELMSSKYLQPEQAIVFHVGEAPELPTYAHHFKAMESKLTCGGHMADVVLRGVYKLLGKFFSNHTQYWSELEEEKGFADGNRVSYEPQEQTDQFYRILIEPASKKSDNAIETKH